MRKAVLAILLSLSLGAAAQVRFHVGGGVGMADMSDVTSSSNILSYRLGGGADIHLGRVFSLRPAVYYTQKGTDFDGFYGAEQMEPAKFSVRSEYLEIPFLAGFDIHLNERSAIVLTVGPHLSCGLNGKTKVKARNSGGWDIDGGNFFDNTCDFGQQAYSSEKRPVQIPQFNRWDLGLMIGAAYEMRHFRFGLVYAHTLTESATSHFEVEDRHDPYYYDDLHDFYYDMTTPRNSTLHIVFDYIF